MYSNIPISSVTKELPMKTILISIIFFGLTANASHHEGHEGKGGPCKAIKEACEKAGFKAGDHKKTGKGLWIDCVDKVAKGETVEGVTIAAADVAACKEKHEERKEKRK